MPPARERLGLALHADGGPDCPDIAHILSQEWWDDGIWDVFTDPRP